MLQVFLAQTAQPACRAFKSLSPLPDLSTALAVLRLATAHSCPEKLGGLGHGAVSSRLTQLQCVGPGVGSSV
eukprot:1056452-Rhodomonas_salina.2